MKKLIALLLLAALALSLAACGTKNDVETETETEAVSTETETETEINEPETAPEEEKYLTAVELYNGGKLEEAYRLLYELKDYKDSKDLLKTIAVMPRKITEIDKDGATTVTERTYEVDEDGYLTKGTTMIYPKYSVHEYQYDEQHRLTGTEWNGSPDYYTDIEYDEDGKVIRFGAFNYEYDDSGKLTRIVRSDINEDGTVIDNVTVWEYDGNGNVIKEYNSGELTAEWKYDDEGRVIERTTYDNVEKYEYDDEGRKTYYNAGNYEERYEYEPGETENVLRMELVNETGDTIIREVTTDKDGAIKKVVGYADDTVTEEEEYFYDEDGHTVKIKTKSYSVNGYSAYDDDGNEVIDPEGTQEYEYNDIGLVVKYSAVGIPYGTGVYEYSDFAYFRLDPFDKVNELPPNSNMSYHISNKRKEFPLDDPTEYFYFTYDFEYRA